MPRRLQQMTLPLNELLDGLRAAAEPTRLRLLAICAEGELTVSEITRILGQSQPRVSRHLRLLLGAGLHTSFRERHWLYYRTPAKGPAAQFVHRLLELLPTDDDACPRSHTSRAGTGGACARGPPTICVSTPRTGGSCAGGAGRLRADQSHDPSPSSAPRRSAICSTSAPAPPSAEAARQGRRSAVGVDISTQMLLVARTNLHAAGPKEVTLRQGDVSLAVRRRVLRHGHARSGAVSGRESRRRRGRSGAPAATGRAVLVVDYARGVEAKRSSIDPRRRRSA